MNRRNFLVALGAALLARKLPHYDMSAFSVEEDVDDPYVRLFDRHHREVSRSAEEIRQFVEALRLNSPSGYKYKVSGK